MAKSKKPKTIKLAGAGKKFYRGLMNIRKKTSRKKEKGTMSRKELRGLL